MIGNIRNFKFIMEMGKDIVLTLFDVRIFL